MTRLRALQFAQIRAAAAAAAALRAVRSITTLLRLPVRTCCLRVAVGARLVVCRRAMRASTHTRNLCGCTSLVVIPVRLARASASRSTCVRAARGEQHSREAHHWVHLQHELPNITFVTETHVSNCLSQCAGWRNAGGKKRQHPQCQASRPRF